MGGPPPHLDPSAGVAPIPAASKSPAVKRHNISFFFCTCCSPQPIESKAVDKVRGTFPQPDAKVAMATQFWEDNDVDADRQYVYASSDIAHSYVHNA